MGSVSILSASQVGTFQQCSLKWAYRYRHRVPPESRSAALVVGSAVDVAVKAAFHAVKSGEVSIESLDSGRLFEEAWEGELKADPAVPIDWGKKGEAGQRETALAVTRAFLDAEDLEERIQRIKVLDFRFDLPVLDPDTGAAVPNLRIVGILDAIEETEAGLRPLDWKTAASRAGYDETSMATHLQGSLYVDALRRIHPKEASGEFALAIGLKLKSPVIEDRVVTISQAARRRAILTVLHAHRAMLMGLAFPQPSFLCGGCPYQRRCGQWQAHANAPVRADAFAASL